eukprot:SAG31_NODE_1272_length_9064_cov_5.201004_2_plen_134_part_00
MGVDVIEVLKDNNDAPMPKEGDTVTIHYIVKTKDGKSLYPNYDPASYKEPVNDKLVDRGRTYTFTVGSGEAIVGLDQAVLKMNEGENFIVRMTPDVAYGDLGIPGVVGRSEVLIWNITLLACSPQSSMQQPLG